MLNYLFYLFMSLCAYFFVGDNICMKNEEFYAWNYIFIHAIKEKRMGGCLVCGYYENSLEI